MKQQSFEQLVLSSTPPQLLAMAGKRIICDHGPLHVKGTIKGFKTEDGNVYVVIRTHYHEGVAVPPTHCNLQ